MKNFEIKVYDSILLTTKTYIVEADTRAEAISSLKSLSNEILSVKEIEQPLD